MNHQFTPEQWIQLKKSQSQFPEENSFPLPSPTVDSITLAKARKAAKTLTTKDIDFCAICLIVLAGKKTKGILIASEIAKLKKDLKALQRMEQRHRELIPKVIQSLNLVILPATSLGSEHSYLARYIFELEMFVQSLERCTWNPHKYWKDALVLLIDYLKCQQASHKSTVSQEILMKVASALDEMGYPMGYQSIRTSYELFKQEGWAPIGLQEHMKKEYVRKLEIWLDKQPDLTAKEKSQIRAEELKKIKSYCNAEYERITQVIREARSRIRNLGR